MSDASRCRRCGTGLAPDDVPLSVCASCMLSVGLEGPSDLRFVSGGSATPERIGPYTIIDFLGEGGMGLVYLAEQQEPLRREVALKVIKPGMDTAQVISRFESERRTLALMDHPNIAKVHDAGVTDEGRPYVVMEFVPGVPITEYCEELGLDIRERLELFVQACGAIQHAHQRGIIHRDIKPSNVMVYESDEGPIVKVIDFGIAKATRHGLTARAIFTRHGLLVGTPEYMSPEQARMASHDVDTRTDVYSLGVLLYELLVGVVPFDWHSETDVGLDEIRRRIREDEPPTPSTRVRWPTTDTEGQSALRRLDHPGLARRLRGDLDWIVLKALEKDPDRRYGSANELVADIRRHLNHDPVLAGPPGWVYRAGKFARRHRGAVTFAAGALTLVVSFAAVMAIQARRTARERDRANLEAAASAEVTDFLVDLFTVADPGEARGNSITAREILDRGTQTIERSLGDQPRLQARLMGSMGVVYRNLGLHDRASPLLEQSLALNRRHAGEDDGQTLHSLRELGALRVAQGRLDEAEEYLSQALDRARRAFGPEDPETVASLAAVGALFYYQGRLEEAEDHYRQAITLQRQLFGNEHRDTLETLNNMAALLFAQGRLAEAEAACREAWEGRRRIFGRDHPQTLDSTTNLAVILQVQGKLEQAEPVSREAVEIAKHVIGPDHPVTLTAINNLGFLLRTQDKLDEAEVLYRDAVERFARVLGEAHTDTITAKGNLGDLYTSQGRLEEAERLLASAAETARRVGPAEHAVTGYTLRKYGRCLFQRGRFAEAEATLLEAHEILSATVGNEHPFTMQAIDNLIELYESWGRPAQVDEWRSRRTP